MYIKNVCVFYLYIDVYIHLYIKLFEIIVYFGFLSKCSSTRKYSKKKLKYKNVRLMLGRNFHFTQGWCLFFFF